MFVVENLNRAGLEPVSFSIDAGECVSLQGPSGSGKSLLLRALADLDPNTGRVALDGRLCNAMPATAWRKRVGYVPANSGWWASRVRDHFTGWERIAPVVRRVGLPMTCGDWEIDRLSTGERQRLALVRALDLGPRVMLLDEPTSGLDPSAAAAVENVVAAWLQGKTCAIWVTHDKLQAARVAARHFRMRNGVLTEGAP